MVRVVRILPLAVGLLLVWEPAPSPAVQPPPYPPAGGAAPQNAGDFRSLPMSAPNVATSPYAPYGQPSYYGRAGGYLAGAANVIGSQGQMMVDQQQAYQMREQVRQSHVQTKHDELNEYLYERAVTPSPVDNAEMYRTEQLRWSRDDPPLTTIWSGRALNDLLVGIQRQQAQGIMRPDIPLAPNIVKLINVTGGQSSSSLALLADDGSLHWPFALSGNAFQESRQTLNTLSRQVYAQARSGNVNPDTMQKLTDAVTKLQETLRGNVDSMDPNAYIHGTRFVNDLQSLLSVLQEPEVGNYLNGAWTARGNTVGQLVANMSANGLRFAPALENDQAAYTALQRAMAAYYRGPDPNRPWDPLDK